MTWHHNHGVDWCWPALAWVAMVSVVTAHGLPIYVSVNAATNQVEVSGTFDDAVVDGSLLSDVPGIGVLSQFSGVAPGKTIRLRMPQDLLYSNSDVLQATSSTVTVYSAEFPQFVEVHENSGFQESLDWAVYPAGAGPAWDADGLYELDLGVPSPGVYGVVVQVMVEGAIDSEPFVILIVYSAADLEASKAAIEEAIELPPSADFTRDWRVDSADLEQWETHYGLSQSADTAKVFGDADDDGDVDGSDFLQWQRQAGTGPPGLQVVVAVPEPAAVVLCLVMGIRLMSLRGNRLAAR